jgi:lipopolysaccharide transport system ATP-binding protein
MDLPMSSNNEPSIRVENLSKYYAIYSQPQDRLKQSILPRLQSLMGRSPKKYFHDFWALRDVSFEVGRGETVGIIGRNGSGKSTLLQLICGTLTPSAGAVYTQGRIAALLELGSGFNPEFSGRENVYLNGAILGLSQEEIGSRFEDIASFADIGEFIEQPVKMYSSGMFVRLAFAVNIMSNPDIMIVDEALSVGDMNFQSKCMTALRRKQDAGMTILFVSHDVGSVKSLCTRGVYLEQGQVKMFGSAAQVAEQYVRAMREEMNRDVDRFEVEPSVVRQSILPTKTTTQVFKQSDEFESRVQLFRYGSGKAQITFVELLDEEGTPLSFVEFNQKVVIKIYFISYDDLQISPNYYILDDKKNLILGAGPRILGFPLVEAKKDSQYIVTYETTLPLQEGDYSIQLQLASPVVLDVSAEFQDVIDDAIVFKVYRREHARIWTKVFIPNTYECNEL